jgi:hypothetical protein
MEYGKCVLGRLPIADRVEGVRLDGLSRRSWQWLLGWRSWARRYLHAVVGRHICGGGDDEVNWIAVIFYAKMKRAGSGKGRGVVRLDVFCLLGGSYISFFSSGHMPGRFPETVTKGNSVSTLDVELSVTTAGGSKEWLSRPLFPCSSPVDTLWIPWFLAHLRHETIPRPTQDTGSSCERSPS